MSSTSGRAAGPAILDRVRDRILSGGIGAGSRIKQDALAADLGVSKIPLREALRRLEPEGLVTSEPNRGFFVRPMSAAEAEEIFALRLKLEPEAVVAGARAAGETERRAAHRALGALMRSIAAQGSGAGRLNRAFHLALAAPAGRGVTLSILERLHILSDRYVRKHLEPMERASRANAEHEDLVAAWLERDAGRIERLAREHIALTLADLRLQLRE